MTLIDWAYSLDLPDDEEFWAAYRVDSVALRKARENRACGKCGAVGKRLPYWSEVGAICEDCKPPLPKSEALPLPEKFPL